MDVSLLPRVRTIDDEFADLVASVPGFGGMYMDENGRLNINLTNPEIAISDAAVARVLERLGQGRRSGLLLAGKILHPATFDYRQLKTWFNELNSVGDGAITFRDIDERNNRLVFGVASSADVTRLNTILSRTSVPGDAIDIVVKPAATPTTTLQDSYRPVIGGFQITMGNVSYCTLGFNAFLRYWWGVDSSAAYFVTNSHCTRDSNGAGMGVVTGMNAGQAIQDSTSATEVADPAFFGHAADPVNCPSDASCRWSDAALFHISSGTSFWHGTVALPSSGITVGDTYTIAAAATSSFESPMVGTAVMKVGRTSGWSWGSVSSTCATVQQTGGKTFLCQSLAPYTNLPGDSGSPVMAEAYSDYPNLHNAVKLVGISWGYNSFTGESLFSIFERVSTELGAFGMGADGLFVTRSN